MAYKLQEYEKSFSKLILKRFPTVYDYSSFLLKLEKQVEISSIQNKQLFFEAQTLFAACRMDDYYLYDGIMAAANNVKDTHFYTLVRYSIENIFGYSIEKILEIRKTGII